MINKKESQIKPTKDLAMKPQRMTTRWMGDRKPQRFLKIVKYTVAIIFLVCCLNTLGILRFRRYYPPRGTTTVDQLAACHPQTFKFALVEQGGSPYIVWIGEWSGAIASGAPVYVFDNTGKLVDYAGDAGESDNKFVLELYIAAIHAPGITAEEAVTYCRLRRTTPPRSP